MTRDVQTCLHCVELERQLQRASDDLVAQMELNKAAGKEVSRIRGKLTAEQNEKVTAKHVQRALEAWAESQPGTPNIDRQGARATLVRKAFTLGHTNPPKPCPVHDENGRKRKDMQVDAECTVVEEIIEAFQGLRLYPFIGARGGRTMIGDHGARRYDDVQYALTVVQGKTRVVSEQAIEQMRGYAIRARMWDAERLWQAYQATEDVRDMWCELAVEAIRRRDANQKAAEMWLPTNVVDINQARKAA